MNDTDLMNYLRETGYGEVLLAAVEQGQLTDDTVTGPNGDEHSVREAAPELKRLGLAHVNDRMSGPIVQANGRGKQIATRIQQSRESGEDRWDAVTRAIALGLIESPGTSAWDVEEVDGRPVSTGDRNVALSRLELWQCVKATKAWGGGVVRLDPLPRIYEIPGVHGSLLRHFQPSGGSLDQSTHSNTHIGDGSTVGAVSTGSPGSIQNVTITTSQRTQILERIQHVREQMGEDTAPELVQAVKAIEAEAQSESATKESFRQRVDAALLTATSNAAGTAIVSGLVNLLPTALGF